MRELLSGLINPVPFLYVLLLLSILSFTIKKARAGKIFIGMAIAWFLIITTPFVPVALVRSLENRYPPFSEKTIEGINGPWNIIVLGGGHSDDSRLSPNNQLSTQALSRLTEGLRIQSMIPGSTLILSGYKGRSELPQALVLYRSALIMGADSTSMKMQTSPENTRMEAEQYLTDNGSVQLVVVTSAVHMPRAMMLFRKAGAHAVAAPSDFLMKYGSGKNPRRFMPSSSYTEMMRSAIHEYAGMIWDWIGGR
jgi:uncharacterized SAM-binding protein YcdF (DUF218 family)